MPAKLSGTRQILAALSKFQPEAKKQLNKEVRAIAQPLVRKARGYAPAEAPLSNWGKDIGIWGQTKRAYHGFEVRSGIGFSQRPTKPNRSGFSYTSYIYNKTAAGAIYETAGRAHPRGQVWRPDASSKKNSHSANPHAGEQFINSMGKMYMETGAKGNRKGLGRKLSGRLIFRAWGEDQGKVLGAVVKAYDDVIKQFNRGGR